MCIYTHLCEVMCKNACRAHRVQKGSLEPLELQLQVVANHLMYVLGTKFWSPMGTEYVLNL